MKKYKWSEKFICVILLFQLIIEIKSDSAFSDSDSYTFETFSLPENGNFMPVLGNGHVGFQILSDSVYMNNLYNGAQGLSHRARIPNFGNIQIINYGELNGTVKYTMDTKSGIFRTSFSPKSKKYRLDHLIYAHRFYDRAIVNQFFISDLNCSIDNNNDSKNFNKITIKIGQYPGNATDDIEFMIKSGDLGDVEEGEQPRETDKVIKKAEDFEALKKELSIKTMCGSTKTVEDPIYQEDPSNCCVLWNHVPEEITLCGTAVKKTTMSSFTFVMTVDEHFSVAQQEMMDVLAQTDLNLLNTHMEEWKHFWNDFDIHMDDSSDEGMNLARTIHASIFYIVSSLPSLATNQPRGAFGGLSPTGLGRGGSNLDDYEGHVFWDSEIWMHIPVLLINPTWSEEMLHYRFLRAFPAALDYAQKTGYKGIRFPWESAFTGREVTQPCCPLVAANQHHITADISYALRLHLATTRDIHWFKREGCKLAIPIAQFWASRVSHNSTTNKYDINNIMGPDEDHENVDNNFYTNIAARQSLQFGQFAACVCNDESVHSNWTEIAENIAIPYDEDLDYHPQFAGYKPGTVIKQADAILVGYPLQFPMSKATRLNDLVMYENVTRTTGPAMNWAIYAINHIDLGDHDRAADLLLRSYRPNIMLPFFVWREYSIDRTETGAVNFLTGAGGFLQAILNGYGGIRIHLDRLMLMRPSLPPSTSTFRIHGIHFLGSRLNISITVARTTVQFTHCGQPLVIVIDSSQQDVICGVHPREYDITDQEKVEIRPKRNVFAGECHIPPY